MIISERSFPTGQTVDFILAKCSRNKGFAVIRGVLAAPLRHLFNNGSAISSC